MSNEIRGHILNYLKNKVRYDGRKLEEYRKVSVETGVSKTAEGSAKVTIGETVVMAGVKFEVGEPYPDIPEEGTMMVNAELLPMSNPEFESGPPGIESIELARVVDRGIRESKAIDTKKLCIKAGELVWTVIIDLIPINHAGNLFDAFALAAMLAIKDAKFPEIKNKQIDYKKLTSKKLPLLVEPVSVTVIKIGDHLIVDPLLEEEKVLDARLTVATLPDGTICALQKGGSKPLSQEEIEKMIDLATEKAKELRKHLR
ncbi:exosome complex protein Rrp42 [Candidatus Woesearchaeota archaeon]|nr:exosome complex protein Rrp42 [Candidatus Woesearchaeota archaeon]